MYKPHRGYQKPAIGARSGISQFQLIKFLESYKMALERRGEENTLEIELLIEYFKNDYDDSRPLVFDSKKIGL